MNIFRTKEKIVFEEIPKNRRYAYARVSSKSQEDNSSLESQKQEFLRLNVPEKNIRIEYYPILKIRF
jgi:hypothetical protein